MNILVLGRSSRLARYIQMVAYPRASVHVHVTKWDITDPKAFFKEPMLYETNWDVVINCAAITNVDWAERNDKMALGVNALGAGTAAMLLKDRVRHFIQISTDYVFDGSNGPYDSVDKPKPINVYGYSKYMGELLVQDILGNQCSIVRVGWLYGHKYEESAASVLEYDSKAIMLWSNIKGTPTNGVEAAKAILRHVGALNYYKSLERIVHVAPHMAPVSWFEFLQPHFPILRSTMYTGQVRRPILGGLAPTYRHLMTSKAYIPPDRESGVEDPRRPPY